MAGPFYGNQPHWLSCSIIGSEVWRRLPEDDDSLEAVARAYYKAPHALALHGSQAAIQLLPKLFSPPGQAAVLHPSYNEHAAAWKQAGHDVRLFSPSALDTVATDCAIVVLIHPNNPTGACFDSKQLLNSPAAWPNATVPLSSMKHSWTQTPEKSLSSHTNNPGLVVLRSLGKFFGLAGARVGLRWVS